MGVIFRSALAGMINEEHDFLCFRCMPHKLKLSEEVLPIFWGDVADGEVLWMECDKCKKEITAADQSVSDAFNEALEKTENGAVH